MFEEGKLLLFRPFLFKNGAEPQDKFFLVLKKIESNILLASLPTSKDHVPSDLEVKHGCLNIPERMLNVFVFLAGENVATRKDETSFAFDRNTFIYGADLIFIRQSSWICRNVWHRLLLKKWEHWMKVFSMSL